MTDLPLEIGPTEVSYLMGRPGDQGFRLIDCREQDEWHICRLPGAVLVPMSRIDELAPLAFTNLQEHLIVYCHHGMRSQRVAQWLRSNGFVNTQSMRGGIDAWSDLVDPDMPRY
ncbi:MAG: rhodanese [Verrucomicrobiaceae bacterium]|nr:rhodanese [Verrucomicrobiaceae bacterium]